MNKKSELREHFLNLRTGLCLKERARQERIVFDLLKLFLPFAQAKSIGVYLSFKNEFSTSRMIDYILAAHKICYAPMIVDHQSGHMIFKPISMAGQRIQWDKQAHCVNQPIDMDCMLVPLVAFDSHHHRIGMGGGFYDRYLSSYQHKKPFLLGLSFQEQWCHTVPHDPWDQPLDAIATAGGIF